MLRKKSLKIPKRQSESVNLIGQTTQWEIEKGQKGKQRSTKQTHKTKDRIKRTPLKPGGERRYSGRVPVPAPKNAFNYELPIALIYKLSFYYVFVFHITLK